MLYALIHWFHLGKILLKSLVLIFLTATASPLPSSTLDRLPTDKGTKKYHQSWNPLPHGSVLFQAVDTQPDGQLSIREFLSSQIRESSFSNRLSLLTDRKNGPVHLYQIR
jgi:hypothetical protein